MWNLVEMWYLDGYKDWERHIERMKNKEIMYVTTKEIISFEFFL